MNIKFKFLLLVSLFSTALFAQDITGLWKGTMFVDSTKKILPYEISISEVNGKLVGYSLITFEEDGKLETGTRDIIIDRKDDKIIIVDVSLLDNSFKFIPPKNIKKTMEVMLTIKDDIMVLEGNWSTNRTKRFLSATGTVKLQRNNDYKKTGLFQKLNKLGLTDNLVFKELKPTVLHDIIKIDSNTVVKAPVKLIDPDQAKVAVPTDSVKKPLIATIMPKEEKKVVATTIISPEVVIKTKPDTMAAPVAAIVKSLPVKPVTPKIIAKAKPILIPAVATNNTVIAKEKAMPEALVVTKAANKTPKPVVIQKMVEIKKPVANIAVEIPKIIPVIVVAPKPVEKAAPGVQEGAADINKRSIASTQSVFFQSDSLVLTLYDNGYVDGDTVSVVMNGNVIFSKQGLSTRPVSKTIYIDKNTPDSLLLVMYAENLGSIPPNTGLLVVHDGDAIYDVRFSADLSTNAAIILRRKKLINQP